MSRDVLYDGGGKLLCLLAGLFASLARSNLRASRQAVHSVGCNVEKGLAEGTAAMEGVCAPRAGLGEGSRIACMHSQ